MISVTEKASNHLKGLVKDTNNVEFSVDGGGCSGMNYNLKFTDREPNDQDQIIYFAEGTMKLCISYRYRDRFFK